MKDKILALLKTKFAGVQDAVLNRVAEKLSKTVTTEDQVQTAVDGVTFQSVLESYGDSRVTEASNSAVSNYEKKHNLKEGKPVTTPKDPEPPKVDDDAHFNSTMVRLIVDKESLSGVKACSFNSTMVRLIVKRQKIGLGVPATFNSTMVRLIANILPKRQ